MQAERLQVRKNLCFVKCGQGLYGFEVDNKCSIDEQVQSALSDGLPFVADLDDHLSLRRNATCLKLEHQRGFVDRLQESRA